MTWPDVRRALRRIPWTQPIPSRATSTARLTVQLRVPACAHLLDGNAARWRVIGTPPPRLQAFTHHDGADFLTLPLWPNGAPT